MSALPLETVRGNGFEENAMRNGKECLRMGSKNIIRSILQCNDHPDRQEGADQGITDYHY